MDGTALLHVLPDPDVLSQLVQPGSNADLHRPGKSLISQTFHSHGISSCETNGGTECSRPSSARPSGLFGVFGWAVRTNGGELGTFDFGVSWPRCVPVMFLSCATTSAAAGVLGESYWNVWDLYDAILAEFWGPGARAGIFFASAVICALLAPFCVPWKIIASASSFLTFLGSYTVFLMPTCGIMIVDYWVVRRGNFHVPSLYTKAEASPYTYHNGWNLRAVAAWIAARKNMYKLGFLLSLAMGSLVYYVLCLIWPVPVYPREHELEATSGFEDMAATEGFFPGESVDTIRGVISSVDGTDYAAAVNKGAGRESVSEVCRLMLSI
ncbi:putative permease [Colletotrichum orbiculare MAFF 240422]|uniref:Permease n=1 Tax=Colletotrichum orbiculare (strain 104-T / ATCC 96160 / CBS 514.97 / LARS 414 / MAFF 240422) TaxID=1213857 RepID=A0A484FQB4_COLOR|nr:putative permease [Colletotrichum orbiculare MAFF 240422]